MPSQNKYRKKIVYTFAFLAAFTLLSYMHVFTKVNQLKDFKLAIDMAGKQRMLINRLSYYTSNILLIDSNDLKQRLQKEWRLTKEELLEDFNLLTGKNPYFSQKINDAIHQYYFGEQQENYTMLKNHLSFMESLIHTLPEPDSVNQLYQLNTQTTQLVDAPVKILDSLLEQSTSEIKSFELFYLIAFVMVLSIIVLFIFRPMERIILRREQELEDKIQVLFNKKEYVENSVTRYKTIIDNVPIGIVVWNVENNQFTDANPKALELFSTDLETILKKNPASLSPQKQENGKNSEKLAKNLAEKAFNTDKSFHFEWMHKNTQGKHFPCEVYLSKIPSSKKYIQGHIIDITKRKELEQKMTRINEDLKRANSAKTNFLAVISHELRTPLNSVIGYSELLKDEMVGPLTAEQKDFCHEIFNNGHSLLLLINEILDLSKIESGKLELTFEDTDVSQLIEQCVDSIKGYPGANNKMVKLSYSHKSPLIASVDATRFRQIVINLLSNAIKFTSTNGTIEISLSTNNSHLILQVSDDGIGIAEEKIKTIFNPFEQVENHLSRKHTGSGLGLAIVNKLVTAHKGNIEVDSEENKGSCFTIKIPLKQYPS